MPGRLVITLPCASREEPIESAGIQVLAAAGLFSNWWASIIAGAITEVAENGRG